MVGVVMGIDRKYLKRYKDEDRPHGKCYDCGLDYNDFVCDMNIQNGLWEMINPTFHYGAGFLCPNCICQRLTKGLGLTAVRVTVDLVDWLPNDIAPPEIYEPDPDEEQPNAH